MRNIYELINRGLNQIEDENRINEIIDVSLVDKDEIVLFTEDSQFSIIKKS